MHSFRLEPMDFWQIFQKRVVLMQLFFPQKYGQMPMEKLQEEKSVCQMEQKPFRFLLLKIHLQMETPRFLLNLAQMKKR